MQCFYWLLTFLTVLYNSEPHTMASAKVYRQQSIILLYNLLQRRPQCYTVGLYSSVYYHTNSRQQKARITQVRHTKKHSFVHSQVFLLLSLLVADIAGRFMPHPWRLKGCAPLPGAATELRTSVKKAYCNSHPLQVTQRSHGGRTC